MLFESQFNCSFENVKEYNLKNLKSLLSPSQQRPQAALPLGGDVRQIFEAEAKIVLCLGCRCTVQRFGGSISRCFWYGIEGYNPKTALSLSLH